MIGLYADADRKGHGFLWDNGVVTTIDFPGALATLPLGLNNRGQIVGAYVDAKRRRGFMLSNGTFPRSAPRALCSSLFSWVSTIAAGSWVSISESRARR